MQRRRVRKVIYYGAAMLMLLAAGKIYSQSVDKCFILPLSITDGPIVARSLTAPFSAEIALSPMIGLDKKNFFRIGARAGMLFTNPDWSFVAGPRIQYQIFQFNFIAFPVFRLHAGAEFLWGTHGRSMAALDLIPDVSLLQLHFSFGYDFRKKEGFPSLGIGIELIRWFSPEPNIDLTVFDQPLPVKKTYSDSIAIFVRAEALAFMDNADLVRKLEVLVRQSGIESLSVSQLKDAMVKQQLGVFTASIDNAIKRIPQPHPEAETVKGILEGFQEAIGLSGKTQ